MKKATLSTDQIHRRPPRITAEQDIHSPLAFHLRKDLDVLAESETVVRVTQRLEDLAGFICIAVSEIGGRECRRRHRNNVELAAMVDNV